MEKEEEKGLKKQYTFWRHKVRNIFNFHQNYRARKYGLDVIW